MKLIGHSISDAGGNILTMDNAVCDLLERGRADLIGKSYLALTHPADRRRNATMVGRLPEGASPITIRKRYLTPDGEPVETDVHVSRLSDAAGNARLIGTLYAVAPEQARFAPAVLWGAARELAQLNGLRRDLFGSDLFCDYALTILLQLYLDEAEGRSSDLHGIARLAGLTPSATSRWLRALETKGFIELSGPETIAQLTGIGVHKILRLLAATAA